MDSKVGALFGLILFFLFLVPFQIDMWLMSVGASHVNKVGSEIRQVIDSSSSRDATVDKAIAMAKDKYGVIVTLDKPNYQFKDNVVISLEKDVRLMLSLGHKEKNGYPVETLKSKESVKITNRQD